ncbi:MAG: hypothetical protein J4G17_09325 [Anaerolineae bacterium]|nr:hypothetical protein [Anaerolineae bacterium]
MQIDADGTQSRPRTSTNIAAATSWSSWPWRCTCRALPTTTATPTWWGRGRVVSVETVAIVDGLAGLSLAKG